MHKSGIPSIFAENIIDVIRLLTPQAPERTKTPLEKPEMEGHYRNACGRHAPSFLKWHIDRIKSLSLIPVHSKGAGFSSSTDSTDMDYDDYLVSYNAIGSHQQRMHINNGIEPGNQEDSDRRLWLS